MAKRKCKVSGRGAAAFVRYLEGTLIPDTEESGRTSTAKDLRALCSFIRCADSATISGHRYTRAAFIDYLRDTLIPDLEDDDSAYADDFREGLRYIDR